MKTTTDDITPICNLFANAYNLQDLFGDRHFRECTAGMIRYVAHHRNSSIESVITDIGEGLIDRMHPGDRDLVIDVLGHWMS